LGKLVATKGKEGGFYKREVRESGSQFKDLD
jgi:hypothetical protein